MKTLHTVADTVLKRIRESSPYYKHYNNNVQWGINRKYVKYGNECRREYAKNHDTNFPPNPLIEAPATMVKGAISSDSAKAMSNKISQLIEKKDKCIYREPECKDMQAVILQPIDNLGDGVLDVLRNPEVNDVLLSIFRGYYTIATAIGFRSYPNNHQKSSWLWHSDCYPARTCKIFLHLTKADEETGVTDFMSVEDTEAYRKAGYYGLGGERLVGEDVEAFAKKHGLPYRPFHINAEPGDASIFDMNYLHRAVAPKKEYRDVVQLLFQPSPISWEEDLERNGECLRHCARGFAKDPSDRSVEAVSMM
ncbi:MAG: hypothetical protein CMB80_00605 [Flammeovirgaceae bacterium]|nr:hypothetical protein [Flammeovirgaceae bacterium]|tara:strand:+ start:14034 stop:14957 length:924 start_codon:yes stop_codon:yes gene_type:complete